MEWLGRASWRLYARNKRTLQCGKEMDENIGKNRADSRRPVSLLVRDDRGCLTEM